MREKLVRYFRAGYPAIAIQTTEEKRTFIELKKAAEACEKGLSLWDAIDGFQLAYVGKDAELPPNKDAKDVFEALSVSTKRTIMVFCGLTVFPIDRDPILNRAIKRLITECTKNGSHIVILAPIFQPPPNIANDVVVMDFDLPDEAAIGMILDGSVKSIERDFKVSLGMDDGKRNELIRAAAGMTTTEIENAFFLAYIETNKVDPLIVHREKVQAVKRSGMLELIEPNSKGMESVGGLTNLKEYVRRRRRAFTPKARKYQLPTPRGIMVAGVPGTGKSLSAKAVGSVLGIPTLRFDIGVLFNSLVGESERRTRETLALAEAVAPVVLWIDEVEKGLAGASGGANDSGVTKRVFGTILSWMQERKKPVFLFLTANDVNSLPAELLRKGRLDEIFAIDLPSEFERREIFRIHIEKRGRDPEKFDIAALAASARDFTGSEIEESIIEAMYNAFDEDREFETVDIGNAIGRTVPLVKTAKEQIDGLRAWAENRARPASAREDEKLELEVGNRRFTN